ncbi:hypothetical protein [Leadbetterella byssophila]|nr:hypothetical protein [Leadbetterella byssophila]
MKSDFKRILFIVLLGCIYFAISSSKKNMEKLKIVPTAPALSGE